MKTIILIALCAISVSVTAQEKTYKTTKWDKMKSYMPVMTKSVGLTFVDFNRLNNRIDGFPQYNALKSHIWTISAGSMHVYNNFVSKFEIAGGSSLSGDPDKRSSTLRTAGANFDLGYDVIPSKKIMVYPLVGLGAETYHALYFRDVNAVDFDDVANSPTLQNNIRKTKFTNSFFTYRLGLGIALNSPNDRGSIGLQANYVSGFQEERWRSAEYQNLDNAPKDGLHRINVSLVLTGGKMMMGK